MESNRTAPYKILGRAWYKCQGSVSLWAGSEKLSLSERGRVVKEWMGLHWED